MLLLQHVLCQRSCAMETHHTKIPNRARLCMIVVLLICQPLAGTGTLGMLHDVSKTMLTTYNSGHAYSMNVWDRPWVIDTRCCATQVVFLYGRSVITHAVICLQLVLRDSLSKHSDNQALLIEFIQQNTADLSAGCIDVNHAMILLCMSADGT